VRLISIDCRHWKYAPTLYECCEDLAPEVDIFCFQGIEYPLRGATKEVETFKNLQKGLTDFQGYTEVGLAVFARREILATKREGFNLRPEKHKETPLPWETEGPVAGRLQYVCFDVGGTPLSILNFHGLELSAKETREMSRLGDPAQGNQFVLMRDLIRDKIGYGPIVLCGNMSLPPGTENLKWLSQGQGARRLHNLRLERGLNDPASFPNCFTTEDLEVREFVAPQKKEDPKRLPLVMLDFTAINRRTLSPA